MKAILVIDMPNYVNSFTKGVLKPIGTVGKLEIGYGSDDGEMERFEFVNTDGALLKPMPQKKNTDMRLSAMDEWLEYSERIGYNKCIDELLGEEE